MSSFTAAIIIIIIIIFVIICQSPARQLKSRLHEQLLCECVISEESDSEVGRVAETELYVATKSGCYTILKDRTGTEEVKPGYKKPNSALVSNLCVWNCC